jgi:hypothetical protein
MGKESICFVGNMIRSQNCNALHGKFLLLLLWCITGYEESADSLSCFQNLLLIVLLPFYTMQSLFIMT